MESNIFKQLHHLGKLGEIAIGEMDKDSLAVSMRKMKTTESIYLLFSIEFKWIK